MTRKRVSEYLVLAAGILIFLGGLAHSFVGWPALSEALAREGVDPSTAGAVGIGWNFGGTAMDAFGLLVVLSFFELRRGSRAAWRLALVIGLFYLVFGLAAFAIRFPNPHFLFFVALGALLSGALLAWPRRSEDPG